ncbi:MAG TPA: DUF4384 domain-containing protein [Pyrinomonadaceae bacterium]|nr:DUF4384 domain-containing protein [Pyrinomonadaceae bacterium]
MKSRSRRFRSTAVFLSLPLWLVMPGFTAASAQESSTTWDKPQQVQRQAKPKRVYRPRRRSGPRPKFQAVPFLTVQYRVVIKRPNGAEGESSLASVFHPGDQLRLGVTANQDGYLYVVYQKEGEDGVIMFPDSRVNNGENFVSRNQEFVLPPNNCPKPNPDECWYDVTDDPAKEYFIVVFSRDQITDLPNTAGRDSRETAMEALATHTLKKEVIESYLRSARVQDYKISSRPARAASPASRYAVWVTNTNRLDNEEIILRVPLNKGS